MPALLLLPALALAAPRANTTALVGKAQCPSAYGPGKHTINLDVTQCAPRSLFSVFMSAAPAPAPAPVTAPAAAFALRFPPAPFWLRPHLRASH